ncbi:MAG: hypothetical protein ACKVP4_09035 [Hyphomicrobium sp.]
MIGHAYAAGFAALLVHRIKSAGTLSMNNGWRQNDGGQNSGQR